MDDFTAQCAVRRVLADLEGFTGWMCETCGSRDGRVWAWLPEPTSERAIRIERLGHVEDHWVLGDNPVLDYVCSECFSCA